LRIFSGYKKARPILNFENLEDTSKNSLSQSPCVLFHDYNERQQPHANFLDLIIVTFDKLGSKLRNFKESGEARSLMIIPIITFHSSFKWCIIIFSITDVYYVVFSFMLLLKKTDNIFKAISI
jgi:hypothetical protein